MTRGEYIVGKAFNPSGRAEVDQIKTLAAAFIDAIDQIGGQISLLDETDIERQFEVDELKQEAVRKVRVASMLAVAAITKPAKE